MYLVLFIPVLEGDFCKPANTTQSFLIAPEHFILFIIYLFIYVYLFLAALGLRCCTWAFSSCGEQGLLFVAVRGLLTAVASLVAEHGL